jgi:hypothetical protein
MRTGPMPKSDRIGPFQIAGQPVDQASLSVTLAMLDQCLAIDN